MSAAAVLLLGCVLLGLLRVVRGPTAADSMMAAQLFGTCGVAIILLLGAELDMPACLDIALAFALLAALTVVAFVFRAWSEENEMIEQRREDD